MGADTRSSDLYFEAFSYVMKNVVGGLYFKNGKPVLISSVEVIDSYNKRVEIHYLIDSKTNDCTVDSIDEFHNMFLTKEEYEKRQSALKIFGFDEETE